ncbi:protein PTCD3 homolog, mitochondrial [Venturia canescens]|uniref:protein PTCD3 homolog, mitochondrial n=1 Tax=Venturia canescens TaxID=32260 RepID=UPI001C9C7922|nr:protein PTCD3 homolog, mitochondrial [Venturia canescens]
MNSLRGRINNRQVTQQLLLRLQTLHLRSTSTATSSAASTSSNDQEIVIPIRIERGATDILSALEKTIKRDHTAPHYKFVDDPYLSPISNRGKRAFALSKEAGRKAAMWIHAEHAELFTERLADPEIKAFLPKARYETKEDASEELLLSAIKEVRIPDALTIYNLLEGEVSVESKQALLELLCFYNSEEQLADDLSEERWYRKSVDRQRHIWKSCPEVEQLFDFLKNQDKPIAARAYSAMISGTAKYIKVDRAWALFEECEKNNIPLSITAYNHLIQLVTFVKDGLVERKQMLVEFFRKIANAGLSPNIETFNSALRVITAMQNPGPTKDLARTLFVEFKNIGIKPSLASYYFALVIFCKDRGPRCSLLHDIMQELEGQKLVIQDPYDTFFFVTAMDVARNHLNDYELAQRVHKLLLTDNNYEFLGEGFKESIYYRHYMMLSLTHLPFEKFMELYDLMVPQIYIPEPSVIKEILEAIERSDPKMALEILPRIWSHMIRFEHLDREQLVSKGLNMMRTTCAAPADSTVKTQYADAAWSYWSYIQEQSEYRTHKMVYNGIILGDVVVLLLRGDQFDRFHEVLRFLISQQNKIIGTMNTEQLTEIFESCLVRGDALSCLNILTYSADAGFEEAISMGQKMEENLPLTAEQQNLVTKIIGDDTLKTKAPATNDEQ